MANAIVSAFKAISRTELAGAAIDTAVFSAGGAALGGAKAALTYDPSTDNKADRFTGRKHDMTQTPFIGRMRAAAEGAVSGAKAGAGFVAADRLGRGVGNAMMDDKTKALMRPRGTLTERFVGGVRAVGGADPAKGNLMERIETEARENNLVRAGGSKQYKAGKQAMVDSKEQVNAARKLREEARPGRDVARAMAEEQAIISQGRQAGTAAGTAHQAQTAGHAAYQQQQAVINAPVAAKAQHKAAKAAAKANHPSLSTQAKAAQQAAAPSAYKGGPTPKQYASGAVKSQGQVMAGPGVPYNATPAPVHVNKKAYRAQVKAAKAAQASPVAPVAAPSATAPGTHVYTADQQSRLAELAQQKSAHQLHGRPMGPHSATQQKALDLNQDVYELNDEINDLLKLDPTQDAAVIQSRLAPTNGGGILDKSEAMDDAFNAAEAKFGKEMPGLKSNYFKERRINKIASPQDEKDLMELGDSIGVGQKMGKFTEQQTKNLAGMALGDMGGILSTFGGMAVGGIGYGVKGIKHLHEESIMKPARENAPLTKAGRISELEKEVLDLRSASGAQSQIDDRLEMINRVKKSKGSLANPNVGSMSVADMDAAGLNPGMRRDLSGGLMVAGAATGALAFGTMAAVGSSAIGAPIGHPVNALGRKKDVIASGRAQMEADASSKIRMSRPDMIGLNDNEEAYYVNQSLKPVRGRHTPGKYNDDGALTLALSALRRG
jgi:hypothetical protein